jgi:Holliday junction resolvasome RuvABC endonuclease subunit
MSIKILALDMATKLGWATNVQLPVSSGVEVFDVCRGASPGARYFKFVKWLQNQIAAIQPDLVVYEQASQRGGPATEILVGFTTHLQSVCYMKKIEHVAIRADHIKIFATGKGKAEKDEMMKACAAKLGIMPIDDNHADALWILEFGKAHYDAVPLVEYHCCGPAQRKKCKEFLNGKA